MATPEDKWFEIWFEEGEDVSPTYLLIVMPDQKKPDQVLVLDPLEKNNTVYRGQNYDEVKTWLLEDEFSLANGRVFPGDGWADMKQQVPTRE